MSKHNRYYSVEELRNKIEERQSKARTVSLRKYKPSIWFKLGLVLGLSIIPVIVLYSLLVI